MRFSIIHTVKTQELFNPASDKNQKGKE